MLYNKLIFFGNSIFLILFRESMVGENTYRKENRRHPFKKRSVKPRYGYLEYKLRWHHRKTCP